MKKRLLYWLIVLLCVLPTVVLGENKTAAPAPTTANATTAQTSGNATAPANASAILQTNASTETQARAGVQESPPEQKNASAVQAEVDYAEKVIERYEETLAASRRELTDIEISIRRRAQTLKDDVEALDAKKSRLQIIAQAADTPWNLRDARKGLAQIDRALGDRVGLFRRTRDHLKENIGKLDVVEADVSGLLKEEDAGAVKAVYTEYLQRVKSVKTRTQSVLGLVERGLDPAEKLESKLGEIGKTLAERGPKTFEDVFLRSKAGLFSFESWKNIGDGLKYFLDEWIFFFRLVAGAESLGFWAVLLAKGIVFAALAFGVGTALFRRFWDDKSRKDDDAPYFRALAALALAVGFFVVGGEAPFILHSILNDFAGLAFSLALLQLSGWFGALVGLLASPERSRLLKHLFLLSAFALVVKTLEPPSVVNALIWTATCLGLGRTAFARGKAQQAKSDRTALFIVAWALFLMAPLALLGRSAWVMLGVNLLFQIALMAELSTALFRLIGRFEAKGVESGEGLMRAGLVSGLGFPILFLTLLAFNLWLVAGQVGAEALYVELLTQEIQWESVTVSLKRLAVIVIGFYLAKSLVSVSGAFIRELPSVKPGVNRGAVESLRTISTYIWWGLYLLIAMFTLGANFTSLAVVAGGLSVGVGFGLQNVFNNFISGLILLFGREVVPGDVIQIGETWGRVERVNIRNTVVQTFENATLFVPNSELVSGRIINWSHKDPRVRRELEIVVGAGSDPEAVTAILIQAAKEHVRVLPSPSPSVMLASFGATGLTFKLRVWIDEVDHAMNTVSELRLDVLKRLKEAGIGV